MSDAQQALPNPNPSGAELPLEESVPVDPESLARHYEQDDVDVPGIVRFGAIIAAGSAVVLLVLWIALRYWVGHPIPPQMQIPPALVTPPAAPGPGLDADPEYTLDTMIEHQDEWLSTYGWLDREAGIVHIPIDQAMHLVVEQAVPAAEGPAPDFRVDPAFRMDGSGGVTVAGEH